MLIHRILLLFSLAALVHHVNAATYTFCNDTQKAFEVAVSYDVAYQLRTAKIKPKPGQPPSAPVPSPGRHHVMGWYKVEPQKCTQAITVPGLPALLYYFAKRDDGKTWGAPQQLAQYLRCVKAKGQFSYTSFTPTSCTGAAASAVTMLAIQLNGAPSQTFHLDTPTEKIADVQTGVIQQKCLLSYDDSQQVHSVAV